MEIQHLKLSDMYEALAKSCNDFEGQKEGSCFADNSNLGCPFGAEDGETVKCGGILPRHWRLVFECGQEQESEPRFQFGDKVLADRRKAVFVHYQYGTTKKAEVLYEEDEVTSTVTSDSIEAGWHDQEECR